MEVTPHPLAPLVALAARSDPASPLLAGRLTATYPRAYNEQLGREEIVNYPNQGAPQCRAAQAVASSKYFSSHIKHDAAHYAKPKPEP